MKKNIRLFLGCLFIFLIIILFYISQYINVCFDNIPFSQIVYTLKYSEGTNSGVLIDGCKYVIPRALILFIVLFIIQLFIKKYIIDNSKKIFVNIKIFNKNITKQLLDFSLRKRILIYIFSCFIFLLLSFINLRIWDYIYNSFQYTKIYEEEYIDSKNVNVTFNGQKRNLVYIVLESEEMTGASLENGGGLEVSYIPNLEKLALNNTNFSNNDKLGGALNIVGAEYTMGSLVAQTAGIPILTSIGNDYSGLSGSFPGVYTLGEILENNGYKNYFLLGSDSSFGGRRDYFEQHGNYKILDYNYAKENNWIDKNYKEWWGFEDKKLFEFAKKELTEISKNDEPFNFTILTADTHFTDGYYDETCSDDNFDTQYANVFHCNDKMIIEFVKWLTEQEFYENTTVILVGDHQTMQGDFYNEIPENFERSIYNVIMNSTIKDSDRIKNRKFTVLDMLPTTLASIGATIDGETLGFGVNLYSDKSTIIERLGYFYVSEEFKKNSLFYNDTFLGSTYYEFKKNE